MIFLKRFSLMKAKAMLLACWLLLAVLYALPRAGASAVNVVKNPGFELGALYWSLSSGASIAEEFAHSGNRSATMAYSAYIAQVFDPPVPSSQVVSFTFWTTRGEGSGGPLYISWTFNQTGSDGGIDAGTAVYPDDVPVGEWVKIDLTEEFMEKAEGRGLVSFSFFRASDNWLQWWMDDVSILVEQPSQQSQDEGGVPFPWPPPPYQPPTPPKGESQPNDIGAVINEWIGNFVESVRLAWQRLMGNPSILLLLIILVLILAYYALRR
jgi:hypothetical protein